VPIQAFTSSPKTRSAAHQNTARLRYAEYGLKGLISRCRGSLTAIASTAGFLLAASVVLSSVALFNGAPLVFSDTLSYSTAAFEREVPGLFSIFYSAFMLPLHGGISFWPVVFVQGAILAHLLYLTARATTGGKIGKTDMIVIVSGLAVFSSLPWVTGQLLPDTFTPVVLLGFFLLAFADDTLGPIELVYVAALTTFAIASHLSHVPIAAGLILLCIVLWLFALGPPKQAGWWIARLALPLILAIASLVAVNVLNSQSFVLARNGNVFLLAKWIDAGPALAYLKRACPAAEYALCEHLTELEGKSHDELKWSANSPFKKVGSFDELEPEARAIVKGTLLSHPFEIIRGALVDAGRQLTRFKAGDGITSEFARWVGDHVGKVYGAEVGEPFLASKQARGELPVAQFRYLHFVGLAIAVGLCLWCWPRVSAELSLLFVFVVAAIVWSAVVTGALSGPYDRYLARVIWLVCFVALLGLFHLVRLQPTPFSEPTP
jgi:hypothetical protein